MSHINEIAGTLFANWLASIFYLLFPLLYDIKVTGIHNYTASPSTLITINHRRDLDIIVAAPILHLYKTLFRNNLRPYFIARDDLFDPGFLSAHFLIPWPLGKIIHRVNIAGIMRALRARPISHLVRKRIAPLLREVILAVGDLKLKDVIRQDQLQEIARLLDGKHRAGLEELSVSDFLGYDYCALHQCFSDVGILNEGLSRKVRKHSLEAIGTQLRVFAHILEEGNICLLAPEGQLSPDGRFWPVKSGLHRLLSMTKNDVRILPINTTYDFMTRGRMRIYVSIGEEILRPKELKKVELEKLVQRRIVGLGPITMGQLGSEYLLQRLEVGYHFISHDQLEKELSTKAWRFIGAGLRLDDRLMKKESFNKRLNDFISYCRTKHILEQTAPNIYTIDRDKVLNTTGLRHWENPVQYSSNEIKSLRELFLTQSGLF